MGHTAGVSDDGWDTYEQVDDDAGAARRERPMSDLGFASSLLRAAAVVSLVLWAVGVITSMWFQWTQLDGLSQVGQQTPSPLLAALAAGFTSTWGYLLVAVVAFAAAALMPGQGESVNVGSGPAPGADDHG